LAPTALRFRCAGRWAARKLARVETYHWGRVPLHTLRANIDYGFAEANTRLWQARIKCWVCKGETKPAEGGGVGGKLLWAKLGKRNHLCR